jgi:hypothetical protein
MVDNANKCGIVHPDMAAYFTIGMAKGIAKVLQPMDELYLVWKARSYDNPVGIVESFQGIGLVGFEVHGHVEGFHVSISPSANILMGVVLLE